jgi:hypothetical protein
MRGLSDEQFAMLRGDMKNTPETAHPLGSSIYENNFRICSELEQECLLFRYTHSSGVLAFRHTTLGLLALRVEERIRKITKDHKL